VAGVGRFYTVGRRGAARVARRDSRTWRHGQARCAEFFRGAPRNLL